MGAWFEGKLVRVTNYEQKNAACSSSEVTRVVSMEDGENKENVTLDANMNQRVTKMSGILLDSKDDCTNVKEHATDSSHGEVSNSDVEDDGFLYHIIFEG